MIFANKLRKPIARCTRCDLNFPEDQGVCHHCVGMTQKQARLYKPEYQKLLSAKKKPLVKLFLFSLVWTLILMVAVHRFFD